MSPVIRDKEGGTNDVGVAADAEFLASLGYKQEFKRDFSRTELFGLSFSIIGVAPSVAYVRELTQECLEHMDSFILFLYRSVLLYSIVYGPVAMVWGVRAPMHALMEFHSSL